MKYKEIKKLNKNERDKKIKELRLELIKSKVNTQKTKGSKTRNIRKIIARIHTFNKSENEELKKK